MCIPRSVVYSTCKQHIMWLYHTICGYVIQAIYPCKLNYLLPLPVCEMDLLLRIAFGWFLLGLHRAPWGAQPFVLLPARGRAHSRGGWKSLTGTLFRSSLMAGGAKRGITNPWLLEESEETRGLGFDELRQQQRRIIEGTRVFVVVLSISGTQRGAFIWTPTHQPVLKFYYLQMSNTAAPGSFLYLKEQHCACNVFNWMQLLKLNCENPDFAHIHGFGVQCDHITTLRVVGALNVLLNWNR